MNAFGFDIFVTSVAHSFRGAPKAVVEPKLQSVPVGGLQELIMLASPSGCHKFQLVETSTPSSDDLFPQIQSPILGSAKTFFFKNNCFEKYVFVTYLSG